jgi:ParB family chromosome partitioning protein
LLEQDRLAQKVLAQNLTVRNLERLMREEPVTVARKAASPPSPHIKDLEKTLRGQLGMRVQVKEGSKQNTGKLVIHYVNLDQFDDLLERLGVKPE